MGARVNPRRLAPDARVGCARAFFQEAHDIRVTSPAPTAGLSLIRGG
jgi:hypothetical protein